MALTFETGPYNTIVSAVATEGRSDNAHTEREIARNANLLSARSFDPCLSLAWDRQNEAMADNGNGFNHVLRVTPLRWLELLPIHGIDVPPGTTKVRVRLYAKIAISETLYVFVHTSAQPFDRRLLVTDSRVFALAGDATWKRYPTGAGVITAPVRPRASGGIAREQVGIFVRTSTEQAAVETSTVSGSRDHAIIVAPALVNNYELDEDDAYVKLIRGGVTIEGPYRMTGDGTVPGEIGVQASVLDAQVGDTASIHRASNAWIAAITLYPVFPTP